MASAICRRIRIPLLIGADICAFAGASILAQLCAHGTFAAHWWQRGIERPLLIGTAWHGWTVALILISLLIYFAARGHYTQRIPFWMALRVVLSGCAYALACDSLVTGALYGTALHIEPALRWLLFIPFLLASRAGARTFLTSLDLWRLNTVIIGDRPTSARVEKALMSEHRLGYRVVGQIDTATLETLRHPHAWRELAQLRHAQFIVMAGRHPDLDVETQALSALNHAGIPFAYVSPVDTLPVPYAQPHYFFSHDIAMCTYRHVGAIRLRRHLKRGFDLLVASVLIVLLCPLFVAIALAVRSDGGPVLFRHPRLGQHGRGFDCLKFRTMRPDAEEALIGLLTDNADALTQWNECRKLQDDPRISRIGHFLRQSSLDELPQLFNVLSGEMSLVGPRPIVAAEAERYREAISYYYEARPGLTGLWQVSGRSNTTYAHRIQLDTWYVRNWSLWHDIVILLKTIPALVLKVGAV